MWNLHNLSQKYSQRPSDLLGLDNAWVAWDFDQAVLMWGNHVQRALDECEDWKKKPEAVARDKQRVLRKLLRNKPKPVKRTNGAKA